MCMYACVTQCVYTCVCMCVHVCACVCVCVHIPIASSDLLNTINFYDAFMKIIHYYSIEECIYILININFI